MSAFGWWVFVGGSMGTLIRYWISHLVLRENPIEWFPFRLETEVFPWATLFVNVSASFLVGLVATIPPDILGESFRMAVLTGFCGGLSTFSTFSMQTFLMIQQGEVFEALLDILLTVLFGVLALVLGLQAGFSLWSS